MVKKSSPAGRLLSGTHTNIREGRYCWCNNKRVREYTGRFKRAVVERTLSPAIRYTPHHNNDLSDVKVKVSVCFCILVRETCRMRALRSHAFTFVDYIPLLYLIATPKLFSCCCCFVFYIQSSRHLFNGKARVFLYFLFFEVKKKKKKRRRTWTFLLRSGAV